MAFGLLALCLQKVSSTSRPGPAGFQLAPGPCLSTALICFVHVITASSNKLTGSSHIDGL